MVGKQEKKKQAVLEVLRANEAPISSGFISAELEARGIDISERTVRLYLSQMDEKGFAQANGRRGHIITKKGLAELDAATVLERVGFLSARIDQMTYGMSFDLNTRSGTVVVNTSIVDASQLKECAENVCKVFEKGYAMGHLLALLQPGERVGSLTIPEGKIGFCSVCSISVNGVFLKHGIPVRSIFGGLMELKNHKARRFVEIIMYEGTSIDPLEVFIRSGMTDYIGAITTGTGKIGASFREIPGDCRGLVVSLAEKLDRAGLGAFLEIGRSGQTLFGIPVGLGHAGAVVIGGLNPISVLEESGYRVESWALSGLLEYNRLFHYSELPARIEEL